MVWYPRKNFPVPQRTFWIKLDVDGDGELNETDLVIVQNILDELRDNGLNQNFSC